MTKIVITAQVKNAADWEIGFRAHGALFKSQTVVSPISFTVNADNKVAIFSEVEDVNKYMEILESSETAEAMAHDGVQRDTVEVFVLDKDFNL